MNAERLLAQFERISEAPDAIARLRRFILDLAVRGKLVEQDPEDEPAEELLGRILELKIRSAGKLPKSDLQLIDRLFNDEPFALPDSWTWVVLGQITDLITSGSRDWAKHYSDSGAIFVRMGNLVKGDYRLRLDSIQHVSPPAGGEGTRTRLDAWDVLVSITGDVGMLGLIPEGFGEAYINQHTALARPCFLLKGRYLPEFLRSDFAQNQFQEPQRGIKNSFRLSDLSAIVVPLPPLAEQHRIVAKVDELMALCDQLEAARQERQECRERLVAATLQRLNQPAEDPASFRQDASFALQVLPSLTTTPAQIKQLRQTILNLAVRGKLVAGSLGRIAAVGDYRRLQNGYAFKSGWFAKSGIRLLRNVNVGHGQIQWNDVAHIPEERFSEFARFSLEEGDIVLTLDRPFIVTGTKVARVNVCDLPALLLQRVGRFVEIAPGVDDDYLFLWINSPHFIEQIDPGRSNGVPHISSKQVEAASILIPPLAEQHRIVAKVDELMALCDQLEQQLSQADQQRRRLLEAVLAEALVGRLTTEQKESHEAIA
jgi:type I restriction enzyme S subunit